MTAYRALLTSLPTGNSTIRMRLWRALKSTGCGVLRDGVYILPLDATQISGLAEAESMVRNAGGFAMIVELKIGNASDGYGALVRRIGAAKASVKRLGKRKANTLVQRLRRSLDDLVEIDFYPGEAHSQASEAMSSLEREARELFSSGEPHTARGKVRRLDPAKYRNRTWATRKDLWVDRLASVWLIKRFIDRNAKFAWIDRPRDRPGSSVGFDFDGAEFTHVGSRVTFEVLMSSFGLDRDPALASLGDVVHFLDVGGIPVADARGIETILKGIKGEARSDDEMALEALRVFDHFYSAHTQQKAA
jgi:hypothetical protein